MSSRDSCCYSGLVVNDANLSAANIQNGNFCTVRSRCAVINKLHVQSSINGNQIPDIIRTINAPRYVYILTAPGADFDFSIPYYIDHIPTITLSDARQLIFPISVKSLYTNVAILDSTMQNIGFLSIQIADPTTGDPLPGVDNPAFIGIPAITPVNGTVATHTLSTPLPENTPFIIRLHQTGLLGRGSGYRFVIIAEV